MENYKQIDREAILAYLQGEKSVKVKNIIEESIADKLRVYPLLFEMEMEGIIIVLMRNCFGAPEIVELSNKW